MEHCDLKNSREDPKQRPAHKLKEGVIKPGEQVVMYNKMGSCQLNM